MSRSVAIYGLLGVLVFMVAANAVDYGQTELSDLINPAEADAWIGYSGGPVPSAVAPGEEFCVWIISDRDPGCPMLEASIQWVGSDGVMITQDIRESFHPIQPDERGRLVQRCSVAPEGLPPGMAVRWPEARFGSPCEAETIIGEGLQIMIKSAESR